MNLKSITKAGLVAGGLALSYAAGAQAATSSGGGEITYTFDGSVDLIDHDQFMQDSIDQYSCTDSVYGTEGSYWTNLDGADRSTYSSSCASNHTSNTPGSVVTATATLRAATAQVTSMVSQRIAAVRKAQSGQGGSVITAAVDQDASSGALGLAGGDKKYGVGVWAQGRFTRVKNDQSATKFDGTVYDVLLGIDKQIGKKVVLGIGVGYENSGLDTAYNSGEIDGDGYLVTPYLSIALNKMFSLDVSGGYAWLDYDLNRIESASGESFAGTTDANRFWAVTRLNLEKSYKKADLGAFIGYSYSREKRDAFTETSSNTITGTVGQAAVTSTLGQIRLGASAMMNTSGKVQPYARLEAEYDVTKTSVAVATNQDKPADDDFGMVGTLGLNLNLSPSVKATIEGSGSVFREDYQAYSGLARLRVEF